MTKAAALTIILLAFAVLHGCKNGGPAPVHTVDLGGVFHGEGARDPLANCAGCHGRDLRGDAGRNCYDCHDNAGHANSYSGVRHNDPAVDCTRCHGPSNTGGIGPACTNCHQDVPG